MAGALKALDAKSAKPAKVGPSLPLARYAGTYADPWYGNIEVGVRNNALTIDFKPTPRMAGTLEHWQYDTFITRLDDKTIEPAYVSFAFEHGKVERITMERSRRSPISATTIRTCCSHRANKSLMILGTC